MSLITENLLAFSPAVERCLQTSNYTVTVTGASGWLGRATIEMLQQALGAHFHERVTAYAQHARVMHLRTGTRLQLRSFDQLASVRPGPETMILHFAFLTKEREAALGRNEFVRVNQEISQTVFDYAARSRQSLLLVPSSGAVYRADRTIDNNIHLNPYGVLKARDERRFAAVPSARVVQPRVFNLAGPFLNKIHEYALGSILNDIASDGPIVLHAEKRVYRSYLHVRDLIDICCSVLLSEVGPTPPPFDTAGEVTLEIGELARRAARVLGRPGIEIKRPAILTDVEDRYVGRGECIDGIIERSGIVPRSLDDQIRDTASYIATLGTTLYKPDKASSTPR